MSTNPKSRNSVMTFLLLVPVEIAGLIGSVSGFVPRKFVAATNPRKTASRLGALTSPSQFNFDTLIVSDNLANAGVDPQLVESVSSGFLSTAKTVAIIGGGIVAFFLVITVVFAAFVIPAAAKELETKIQKEYPDLWDEYQAKLGEGETLSQRPDLIQELGNRLQRLQMEDYAKAQAAGKSAVEAAEEATGGDNSKKETDAVDAEFTKENEQKDE